MELGHPADNSHCSEFTFLHFHMWHGQGSLYRKIKAAKSFTRAMLEQTTHNFRIITTSTTQFLARKLFHKEINYILQLFYYHK